MSLRDHLDQVKSAKATTQEQVIAANQEQQQQALKETFDGLIAKRTALSTIKEAASTAQSEMKGAKTALKAERQNLRALHKESVDIGDNSIPKPDEVIKGEEFQEAEEVQSYNSAREAFKLSADKIKEVQTQLEGLGITDIGEMLPGQLEAALEAEEKEVNDETRAFVLEHPDVNPEMAAKVREELVSERADSLTKRGLAVAGLSQDFERSVERNPNLKDAVQTRMEQELKDPVSRKAYIAALRAEFGKDRAITDIDKEAMARVLARGMFKTPGGASASGITTEALAKAEFGTLQNVPEEFQNPHAEDPRDRVNYKKLEERYIGQVQTDPNVRNAVEQLATEYGKVAEHEGIPGKLQENKDRLREIETRLAEFGDNSIHAELLEIGKDERKLQEKKTALEQQEKNIKDFPRTKEDLMSRYRSLMEQRIVLGDGSFGSSAVSLPDAFEPAQALTREIEASEDRIKQLGESIAAIRAEPDGFMGGNKGRKEKRAGELNADILKIRGSITQMETDRTSSVNQVSSNEEHMASNLKNYIPLALQGGFAGGSVREMFDSMSNGTLKALTSIQEEKNALKESESAIEEKKRVLNEERVTLQTERRAKENEVDSLESQQRHLNQELRSEGLL